MQYTGTHLKRRCTGQLSLDVPSLQKVTFISGVARRIEIRAFSSNKSGPPVSNLLERVVVVRGEAPAIGRAKTDASEEQLT